MIFFSMFLIILLLACYGELGYLTNIGFNSHYDDLMFRQSFEESLGLRDYLEKNDIKDGLFGELSYLKTFEYRGYYSTFWVSINRWLMTAILIIVVFLIINRILAIKGKTHSHLVDIPLCICSIVAIVGYYHTCIYCGKYETVSKGNPHGLFYTTCGVAVITIIFGVLRHIVTKRDREYKEYSQASIAGQDLDNLPVVHKKRNGITVLIMLVETIIFALTFIVWYKPYRITQEYSSCYGVYDIEEHPLRLDLESEFNGNYINQAVETDEGLFFLERADIGGKEENRFGSAVYKLDKDGKITNVYAGDEEVLNESGSEGFFAIGYCNGYIYLCRRSGIVRMNPEDGSFEVIISPAERYEFTDACVVDNKLYYLEQDKTRSDFEHDKLLPNRIMFVDISGDTISEPDVYLSHVIIKREANYYKGRTSELLKTFITNEYVDYNGYENCRDQWFNGQWFCLYNGNPGLRDVKDYESTLFISGFGRKKDVSGYTIYKEKIYYVQLKAHGFDVCKCNLDGTGIEVIDTYKTEKNTIGSAAWNYRIMIGQGKILVDATGEIFTEYKQLKGRRNKYEVFETGTIRFVTDFK